MILGNTNKARICFSADIFKYVYLRLFEKPKIMLSSAAKERANDLSRFFAYGNKGFHGVPFFLTGVIFTLFFLDVRWVIPCNPKAQRHSQQRCHTRPFFRAARRRHP